MNRLLAIWLVLVAALAWTAPTRAEEAADEKGDAPAEKTEKTKLELKIEKARADANEVVGELEKAYMFGRWEELEDKLRQSRKHYRYMRAEDRKRLSYMRSSMRDFRPKWWSKTKSGSNVSFRANIWNRGFTANYMPSGALGYMQPVGIYRGKLQIIVTWKPSLVDNPAEAEGWLAKRHGIRKGDIGEAIVWHELGHNYVTTFLPLKHVMKLYMDHNMLFHHLQEFYAELTSLYHASPRARLAMMMVRIDSLDWYDESEPHARMAYAIGSMVLAKVLEEPSAWPSFHLPPEVPAKDIERRTLIYMYEHLDPNYSVTEDQALREWIHDFIRKEGEGVLRNKGEVPLENDLTFMLMATDDRKHQAARDQWVARKLQAAIDSGLADKKPEKDEKDEKDKAREKMLRGSRIEIPW